MIKTILFDVDGTLIDTAVVMTKALQETLRSEKGLRIPLEDLQFILGITGQKALENFTDDSKEIALLHQKWSQRVLASVNDIALYPEMADTLNDLKQAGITLGIVTSKTRQGIESEFNQFNLIKLFDVVITATDTTFHKPHPEPILKALATLEADKKQTLFVGDSVQDRECARASGVAFALASWGVLDRELPAVDYAVATPKDLLALIN